MDPTPFPNAPFMEAEDSEDPELIQAVNNVDALPFYSYSTWSQLYLVGMPQDTENVMANYIMKEERRKLAGKKKKYHLELLFGDCFPVDLFFEILGHLHPIDLYHMSLANKSSRKAVMSRSGSLWKTCFARHPELPSCPTDMSEQNWAILLFSPFLCDECGIHSAVIDFAYRRRLCYDCLRLNQVVRTPQNEDITYQENDPIWDLAPASNREGGDSYWFPYATLESTRRDGRYLKRDILAVAKELQELQIQNPEAVESWKRNKEKYTGTRIQHAERCNKWAADIFDLRYEEDRERQSRIEDRVIERMISLGHDRDDVATNDLNLFLFYSNVEIPKLTRRVWRLIKTPVENVVSTTKENRRRWAREDLLRRRGEVLRATYLAHQKALEPRSWITLPDYEDLLRFEAFSDLMNDASEIDLTPLACRPAMDKLPEYVVDWGRRRMAHMMNLLPNSEASELDRDGAEELCIQKLSLATSIFACVDCKLKPVAGDCLFGWHDVSTHARCYKMAKQGLKNIVLCTNGASIASAVVTFLGLDPSTASASEMDQLEARLVCSRCPMRHHRGTFGRKAYTWRDYVAHVVQMQLFSNEEHSTNSCDLLTAEVTDLIRLHEDPYPHVTDKAWSCNHCSVHFSIDTLKLVPRRDVVSHVRQVHSIPAPRQDVDFFHNPGVEAQNTPRRPVGLQQNPSGQFRCIQCPNYGTRLYSLTPLMQHLTDRHEILSPVLDTDYVRIDIILKSLLPTI